MPAPTAPPPDREAEKAVLSRAIVSSDAFQTASALLQPRHFLREEHAHLAELVWTYHAERNGDHHLQALFDFLRNEPVTLGLAEDLAEYWPTDADLALYVDRVFRAHQRRSAYRQAHRLLDRLADPREDVRLALGDHLKNLSTLERPRKPTTATPHETCDPKSLLPAKGFVPRYVEYAEKYTDAPPLFHIGVAYAILAAAVGTNAYYELWSGPTYPNLYALLVGSSATTRKTTAMNLGRYVLAKCHHDAIWPEEWSFEGFLQTLSERPQGMLILSEFGSLISAFTRGYSEGAKPFLVTIYDCPEKLEKVLVTKTVEIHRPCPTILAGSDEVWLGETLGRRGIKGGLLSRLLLFCASRHDKTQWMGIGPKIDTAEIDYLADYLRALRDTRGTLHLTDDARQAWEEWVKDHEERIDSPESHPDAPSALGRLPLYTLKLAALNAIATRERTEVQLDDISSATKLISLCRDNTSRFLLDLTDDKDTAKLIEVRKLVQERPGITQRELMRTTRLLRDDLTKILDALQDAGTITTTTAPRGQVAVHPL